MQKENYAEQLKCSHKRDTLPPWKSATRNERFKKLFIETGNASLGLRENAGVVANDHAMTFPKKLVEQLFLESAGRLDLLRLGITPPLIFVVIDPNGDGPSKMAIVSGFICSRYVHQSVMQGTHVVRVFIIISTLSHHTPPPKPGVFLGSPH